MIKCASELEVETIAINFDPVVVIPFDVVWEDPGRQHVEGCQAVRVAALYIAAQTEIRVCRVAKQRIVDQTGRAEQHALLPKFQRGVRALAKPIAKIVLRPILQGLKRVDLRLPQCAVVGGAVGPRVHYLSAQDKIAHLVLRVDTRLQEQEFFAIRAERSELPIDCLTPNAELAGDREPVLALLRTGCGARARARGRRQILFDRCGPSERIDRSSRDGHFHCPRRAFLGCCRKRREKR